jgi:hypothetical protein
MVHVPAVAPACPARPAISVTSSRSRRCRQAISMMTTPRDTDPSRGTSLPEQRNSHQNDKREPESSYGYAKQDFIPHGREKVAHPTFVRKFCGASSEKGPWRVGRARAGRYEQPTLRSRHTSYPDRAHRFRRSHRLSGGKKWQSARNHRLFKPALGRSRFLGHCPRRIPGQNL